MLERPILTPELRARAKELRDELDRLHEEDPDHRGMSADELMERARRNRARQKSAGREDGAEN